MVKNRKLRIDKVFEKQATVMKVNFKIDQFLYLHIHGSDNPKRNHFFNLIQKQA